MKIRFKFSKKGRLKYIGHLDLLNIWNRAIKSAKLPVSYSNGFNPHMLISFASPLPLGITSVSEYVDIDFDDSMETDNLISMLNSRFPDGLEAMEVYRLEQPYKRIASVVEVAEYRIHMPFDVGEADIEGFMSQGKIEIEKKTKKKNEVTDIMPDILGLQKLDGALMATLSCGSVRNLKPTLFADAFCRFLKADVPLYRIQFERMEIFSVSDSGEFVTLSKV